MLRRSFLAVCIAVLALASCKINTINYFPPHPAQVRVLNLIPGSNGVDVQVTGQAAFTNVGFQTVTEYQTYVNQTTQFTVTFTGTNTTIGSFAFPLGGEQPYTLVVYGTTTSPLMTMVAEVASAPTNGNVQFSVFNAAQNAPSVDLYVTAPGADITNLNPNFASVSFSGSSFNIAFAPGTYQIQVTLAGTKTVIYDSGGTVYTPNIALSFIMYALGSGTLINAAVLQSKGPYTTLNTIFARLKAVNATPGTGSVNMLQGTAQVILGVLYPSGSPYAQTARGATTVNFEATAAPGTNIASVAGNLAPATDTTAVVAGSPGATTAFLLQDFNILPASGGDRLRFVNASSGSNPVNAAITGTQVATNIAFGTASAYVATSAATVEITFTDAASGAVVATLPGVVLTANQTSSAYLVGPPGAQNIMVTQDY